MTRETTHLINKQKHNERTNRQKDIKSYNTLEFIPNRYKTIKISMYPYNEEQGPIKRDKQQEQRYTTQMQHMHYTSLAK